MKYPSAPTSAPITARLKMQTISKIFVSTSILLIAVGCGDNNRNHLDESSTCSTSAISEIVKNSHRSWDDYDKVEESKDGSFKLHETNLDIGYTVLKVFTKQEAIKNSLNWEWSVIENIDSKYCIGAIYERARDTGPIWVYVALVGDKKVTFKELLGDSAHQGKPHKLVFNANEPYDD